MICFSKQHMTELRRFLERIYKQKVSEETKKCIKAKKLQKYNESKYKRNTNCTNKAK